jgi:hypothetical protein
MISRGKIAKISILWIRQIIERIELLFGKFFIFKIRSIKIDKILQHYLSYKEIGNNIVILMQGPVIKKAGFTYETLKLYRKIYPNIRIILSTWDNTDTKLLDGISKLNISVITSKLPMIPGDSNINFQLKSTIAGLEYLKDFNIKYVLKTRTDQRIYSTSNYLLFMGKILEAFPIKKEYLQKRLLVSNLNMFRRRKYCISDMFMFGTLDDMKLFWNLPLQEEILIEDRNKEFFENNLAEAYLINWFFRNMRFVPRNTMEDSDKFLKEYFYIIDKNVIDLFWYKYNHTFEKSYMVVDDREDRPYSTLDWQPE